MSDTNKSDSTPHNPSQPAHKIDVEKMEKEIGGRKDKPEPTRYGDWESGNRGGIISDF